MNLTAQIQFRTTSSRRRGTLRFKHRQNLFPAQAHPQRSGTALREAVGVGQEKVRPPDQSKPSDAKLTFSGGMQPVCVRRMRTSACTTVWTLEEKVRRETHVESPSATTSWTARTPRIPHTHPRVRS
jgi:hypothetical protein